MTKQFTLAVLIILALATALQANPKFYSVRYNKTTSTVLEMNQGQTEALVVGPPQSADEALLAVPWRDMAGHPPCEDEPTPATKAEAMNLGVSTIRLERHAEDAQPHVCCRGDAALQADIKIAKIKKLKVALVAAKRDLIAITETLDEMPGDTDLLQQQTAKTSEIAKIKADLVALK